MAIAAAVVLLGATAAVALPRLTDNDDSWTSGGPVRVPFKHGYVVRYGVGDVFSDGMERIKLVGNQPGVLSRVEITGPSADHFQVVGVLLAGPHRRIGSWQVAPGFPPQIPGQGKHPLGTLVPAQGAPLATGDVGSVLEIGLKVVKPGLGIRTGVRLFYTVNGKRYTVELPASIANCPTGMTVEQCQDAYLKAAG
ncbi:MAG TPA: hypothetical protein VMT27_03485 [Actinomycetes bacterium]|nr:hypothetical protein [Actinomycetes bacterium]